MTSLAHFEKVAKAIETDACDMTMPFGGFRAIRVFGSRPFAPRTL